MTHLHKSGEVFTNMDNSISEESSCMETDCESPTSPEPLKEKELSILCNKSVQYKVLEIIGEGAFGKVAKCVNLKANETTAIKILKDVNDFAEEVEMLEKLRTLDPEKNNLVGFVDSFIDDDKSCIAFECLDRSLLDLMVQREEPLTLNEIRPITRQLLVALNALKGIGLLHADLKLDNVMLVNHQDEPFRVKLIDFGVALPASEVWEGMIVQPLPYRAPEVSLGLPISEAIDMWALGCLLACLFFCRNIFNGDSSYDVMKTICCLLGQPQDHLLDAGKNTHQYFKSERCSPNSQWRLKTPEEYKKQNDDQLQLSEWEFDHIGHLADAVNKYSNAIEEVEVEDTRAFLKLLKMLLNPDAEMRITPEEALEHSFVTMSHLADYAHRSSYTQAAFELMVVCPACDSDECHEYLSDFESKTESSDSGEVSSNMDNSSSEESSCMESDCETATSPEPLKEKELSILHNKSVQYKVLEIIGEGTYGKVAKCVNMKTNENTAIKILKDINDYAREVKMLQKLRTLDPEKNHLVRFMDSFIVDDKSCIAFECLDRSLLDLIEQREEAPLTLNEIRPITRQLLVALNALKSIGLLYTDLKLHNVMLVNHQDQPFKVKLIDFGLAMTASDVREGMIVQPLPYRAPEVSLGLPISEAIDMWALGCLLACLFFWQNIFFRESTYDVMKTICCLLGQPQDHLLDAGKYTHQYFKRNRCTPTSRWRLKTPEEYEKQNDDQLQLSEWEFDHIGHLADAVNKYSNAIEEVEVEDTRAFLNLLQMLLNPDAEMRITPEEALEHSFVTMSHLADYAHRSSYTQAASELMVVCPACDSDKCHEHLSDFESKTESSDSGEVFSNVDNSGTEESYCMGSNCDTPTSPEPLQEKVLFILHNKSVRYKVLEFIGEGGFGKVAKCVNMNTNENTAIKLLKDVNNYTKEVKMLQKLRNLDPERNNLVRFMDSFIDDDMSCIAFECLDRSLWDLMLQREERLTLNEIRPITRQLLVALNALKGIGLLHADLKLDNVMLVNHQDQPFRVKLIDFGLAMPASKVREGMIVQACAYRAPEVSLGLPISEAIDMWSLGCLLACLFLCQNIFNGESSYDVMKTICCLLGQPQDHLLDAGQYTHQYFKRKRCTRNSRWRLKTPEEYDDQLLLLEGEFDQIGNLADAVNVYSDAIDEVEVEDTRAFLNLLQMLLNPDAEMRITPQQALEHSFVTMSHLADYAHRSSYTQAAIELMVVWPACDSDKCHEHCSDFESNMESSDSGEVSSNTDNSRTEEAHCMESNCETASSPKRFGVTCCSIL
ncbi:uncharacterized protein LOC144386324 [Gasterosteus aculeatus]